ncbi:putative phage abortive infection protein [Vibrio sp.]|uniref:putative phage abortive infection protein n=1 Tax=Vibrio sp. TaxID=678 RepID=UPI003AA91036
MSINKIEKNDKQELNENDTWNLFFYGFGFVIFLSLFAYLLKFHSGFSNNHTTWGEFGSYFGGVTGPLISIMAFIGLLKSISLTKKQFEIQSQESTFFNLLNLHDRKVDKVNSAFLTEDDSFKYLCEMYSQKYDSVCRTVALEAIVDTPHALPDYTYHNYVVGLIGIRKDFNTEEIKKHLIEFVNRFETKIEVNNNIHLKIHHMVDKKNAVLVETGRDLIRQMSVSERVLLLSKAYDSFYDEYGHISGSYIRNVYYVLLHSKNCFKGLQYAKVFRAQLSRYEISLIYFNMLSCYCQPDFLSLIKDFDILNELYLSDLYHNPSEDMYKEEVGFVFSKITN